MRAPPWAFKCVWTDNCDYDEPLKVTPHSPDTFLVPFVTRSPPNTLSHMYVFSPVLSIWN